MNSSYASIERYKHHALRQENLQAYASKLHGYKYVDELQDMYEGSYVRWIHLKRRKLTNGAFLLNVDLRDDGVYLLLKGLNDKIFSLWADECLLFQKIPEDEKLFLRASQAV